LSDVANASDGLCTLREAITAANNNIASGAVAGECAAGSSSGSDTIDLSGVTGTVNLQASALPNIASNMTIIGPGSSNLTVHRDGAAGQFRLLTISSGVVAISGLTMTNGHASDGTTPSGGAGQDGGG